MGGTAVLTNHMNGSLIMPLGESYGRVDCPDQSRDEMGNLDCCSRRTEPTRLHSALFSQPTDEIIIEDEPLLCPPANEINQVNGDGGSLSRPIKRRSDRREHRPVVIPRPHQIESTAVWYSFFLFFSRVSFRGKEPTVSTQCSTPPTKIKHRMMTTFMAMVVAGDGMLCVCAGCHHRT